MPRTIAKTDQGSLNNHAVGIQVLPPKGESLGRPKPAGQKQRPKRLETGAVGGNQQSRRFGRVERFHFLGSGAGQPFYGDSMWGTECVGVIYLTVVEGTALNTLSATPIGNWEIDDCY